MTFRGLDPAGAVRLARRLERSESELAQCRRAAHAIAGRRPGMGSELAALQARLLRIEQWCRDGSRDLVRRAQLIERGSGAAPAAAGPPSGPLDLEDVALGPRVLRLAEALERAPDDGSLAAEHARAHAALQRLDGWLLRWEAIVGTGHGGAGFFALLTDEQIAGLVAAMPGFLATRPGVPLPLRTAANRTLVDRELARTERDLERRQRDLVSARTSRWRPAWDALDGVIGVTSPTESAVEAIARLVPERDRLRDLQNRDLIWFDWEGDGRIAEWHGPLDASHVVVYLPGTGHSKATIEALRHRPETMLAHGGDDLAVVTAMVYDAPDHLVAAAGVGSARAGAGPITEFVASLDLAGRHLTLLAHSYATVALAEALRTGLGGRLGPDADVVFIGSPGLGVAGVDELGVDPARVWAALTDGDEIRYTGLLHDAGCAQMAPILGGCTPGEHYLHGPNPAHPSFGARLFATGEIADRPGVSEFGDEHGEYWAVDPGTGRPSEALANLLRIARGERTAVTGAGASTIPAP